MGHRPCGGMKPKIRCTVDKCRKLQTNDRNGFCKFHMCRCHLGICKIHGFTKEAKRRIAYAAEQKGG